MRINSLSYNKNSSFKARLSPKVENGFWFLGEDIKNTYKKDSCICQKYKDNMFVINNLCPKYVIREIEIYNPDESINYDLSLNKFGKKPVLMNFNALDNEEDLYSMINLSALAKVIKEQDIKDNQKKETANKAKSGFFKWIRHIF